MKRREFIKTAGAVAAGGLAGAAVRAGHGQGQGQGPNILFVMTDQQFGDAMSCRMGDRWIRTPAMDSLAATGMVFTRAYTANPLCRPVRNAIFTGRYPHTLGCQTNGDTKPLDMSKTPFMGAIFREAGYDTGYCGKTHFNIKSGDTKAHGFEFMRPFGKGKKDPQLPGDAAQFIRRKRDRPFLLVTSFMNPHNICQWARSEPLPDGPIGDPPPPEECPPLVPNHLPPRGETDIIERMRRSYQRAKLFPVSGFDEGKWRQFRWAYYRMIEKVDAQIGQVLAALRDSGQEENTVVIFISDHGDCHGAHKWNQKTVFYDESARVPLIVSWKGRTRPGTTELLAQTGIDLLPTMCDYAGIEPPAGLPGRSLRQIADGRSVSGWRDHVVVSNHMVQGAPLEDGSQPKPHGRMVRSERYKYCVYSEGERRESLVDMIEDPGEMVNLAGSPSHQGVLRDHRNLLAAHAVETDDTIATKMVLQ